MMMMNFNQQHHQQQQPSPPPHHQPQQYQQYRYDQHYQHRQEPSAPPRRKRSLSTGRYEPSTFQDHFQDGDYYGYQNPMNSNFGYPEYPQGYNQSSAAFYNNNPNFNSNGYPAQFRAPNPLENLRPLLVNNQPSLLFAAMATPMSTRLNERPRHYTRQYSSPLFSTSMGMISNNNPRINNGPVRPHYDLIKSTNIPYNPYQTKFTPTLMAKPSLEMGYPTQISNSVATAIARGRDSMYSSKERLAQQNPFDVNDYSDHHVRFAQSRSPPPSRPPPPKLHSRLSMENLSSTNHHHHHSPLGSPTTGLADYATVDRSRRDRRSLSPTRAISPGLGGQRPFLDGSRPTSPLSGLNSGHISPTRQLSRTPSVNNNHHPHRSSRTPSREPSPMRTFLNFATNSAKSLLTPKTSNGRNSTSFSREKSPSYTDVRSPTSGKAGHFDYNNNELDLNRTGTNRMMDELQVPTAESFQQAKHVQDLNRNQNHQYSSPPPPLGETKQFSQAFTDHCDQYKSVTSKILGGGGGGGSKRNSRLGGDLSGSDVHDMNWNDLNGANNKFSTIEPETFEIQNRNDPRNNNINNHMMNHDDHRAPQPIQDDLMLERNPNSLAADPNQKNDWPNQNFAQKLNEKLLIESMKIQQQQDVRRNSSGNNQSASQRKASLPAEYIAKTAKSGLAKKLPEDWSRENVAQLAHEARERKLRPQSKMKERVQKIGVWFTKQFIFLLVCLLNILLAYVFYNLMVDLPRN